MTQNTGNKPVTPHVRYVWLDEDGAEVSPQHAKFFTALSFRDRWDDHVRKLRARYGDDADLTQPSPAAGYSALTKTGKPPVTLKRIIVEVRYDELTLAEKDVLKSMLDGQP